MQDIAEKNTVGQKPLLWQKKGAEDEEDLASGSPRKETARATLCPEQENALEGRHCPQRAPAENSLRESFFWGFCTHGAARDGKEEGGCACNQRKKAFGGSVIPENAKGVGPGEKRGRQNDAHEKRSAKGRPRKGKTNLLGE